MPYTVAPTGWTGAIVPPTGVPAVEGGRPFAANSPWNTPLIGDETWTDVPVLYTRTGPEGGGSRYAYFSEANFGIWYGAPTDPVWRFDLQAPFHAEANRTRTTPKTVYARGPANMRDGSIYTAGDSDHILTLISNVYEDFALTTPTGDNYIEMWGAECFPLASPPYAQHRDGMPGYALGNVTTGPGAATTGGQNDGVRAANFSWIGGALTAHDLDSANEIEHALVISLTYYTLDGIASVNVNGPYVEGPDYVYPATMLDVGFAAGPIIMGSRFGIPPGTTKPTGLSPEGEKLWTCLSTYGLYVGDYVGGQWPIIYCDGNNATFWDYDHMWVWWDTHPETGDGNADMESIWPLMRLATPA